MIGSRWGRVSVYGKKTLAGQLGFVGSVLGMIRLVTGAMDWWIVAVAALTSVEELVCEEIDNYILPLFFMSLLLGIHCCCLLDRCNPLSTRRRIPVQRRSICQRRIRLRIPMVSLNTRSPIVIRFYSMVTYSGRLEGVQREEHTVFKPRCFLFPFPIMNRSQIMVEWMNRGVEPCPRSCWMMCLIVVLILRCVLFR